MVSVVTAGVMLLKNVLCDTGLVIDRGGNYKDGHNMKSPSVKMLRHAPITFVESGFCGGS